MSGRNKVSAADCNYIVLERPPQTSQGTLNWSDSQPGEVKHVKMETPKRGAEL